MSLFLRHTARVIPSPITGPTTIAEPITQQTTLWYSHIALAIFHRNHPLKRHINRWVNQDNHGAIDAFLEAINGSFKRNDHIAFHLLLMLLCMQQNHQVPLFNLIPHQAQLILIIKQKDECSITQFIDFV